jgi:MoaA/NifB/PqqE/SkfB family radical SAM enzyme
MNLLDKVESGINILKIRFLDRKIPIAVRIELTNRCPNKCIYCDLKENIEMSKKEVFRLLDELKKLGTKKISFSGGEPMIRKDIGEIIDYAKSIGISPEMNSCGFAVKERINEIKNLDVIKISLDGDREVHSLISQRKNSFDEAISAIEICRKNGILVVITTTLTRYNTNIKTIEKLLDIAKGYNVMIAFQPVKKMYYSKLDLDDIIPDKNEYQKVINFLIDFKKKSNGYLRNSISGLKYIYNHPFYNKKVCVAGKAFIIVDVDGTVYPCDRVDFPYESKLPNWKDLGVKKAIENLPKPRCSGCGFCGAIELGFLVDFRLDIISTVKRLVR